MKIHSTMLIVLCANVGLLCDLTVGRYSKAALPFPYKNSEPSLNYGGTPYQGDAFYVRDPIDMDGNPSINLSADQILKLCCINAIHGQHDAIAELVKVHSAILSNYFDCKTLLDALAKRVANGYFGDRSYEEVIAAFEDDDIIFYPVLKKKMSASKVELPPLWPLETPYITCLQ